MTLSSKYFAPLFQMDHASSDVWSRMPASMSLVKVFEVFGLMVLVFLRMAVPGGGPPQLYISIFSSVLLIVKSTNPYASSSPLGTGVASEVTPPPPPVMIQSIPLLLPRL